MGKSRRTKATPGAILIAGGAGIALALARMGKLLPILREVGKSLGGAVNKVVGGTQAAGDQVAGGVQAAGDQVAGGTQAAGDQVAGGVQAVGDQAPSVLNDED